MIVMLNGALMPSDEARVSVFDRGFLYGDAVFETMAVYGGAIFRLDQHLRRLANSASLLGFPPLVDAEALAADLYAVQRANDRADGLLRLSITRGRGQRGLDPRGCVEPTCLILSFPPPGHLPALRRAGARVIVSGIRRTPDAALPAAAKTANYLSGILAFREAAERDAHEALMLTIDGDVAEGTVSNVFLVRDGALLTPALDCGILPGITRAAVIELARELGIAVREARLPESSLAAADEIFYTNTSAAIMPVARLDDRALPAPGPITSRLADALAALVAREAGPFW